MSNDSALQEQNETNKLSALQLAKQIYCVVMDERFRQIDPDSRHKVVTDKYPNFAQAYPVILRWMTRDLKYNERAFRRFLDRLEKNPGKGMEGYIENQANYARILYEEDCKTNHRHIDKKFANNLYLMEYQNMMKWYKKIQKEEEEAKNEFHDEETTNLAKKRAELLDFINMETKKGFSVPALDPLEEEAERRIHNIPAKNPNFGFADINIAKLGREERISLCTDMVKFLHEKDRLIHKIQLLPEPAEVEIPDFSSLNNEELLIRHNDMLSKIIEKDDKILQLRNAEKEKQLREKAESEKVKAAQEQAELQKAKDKKAQNRGVPGQPGNSKNARKKERRIAEKNNEWLEDTNI